MNECKPLLRVSIDAGVFRRALKSRGYTLNVPQGVDFTAEYLKIDLPPKAVEWFIYSQRGKMDGCDIVMFAVRQKIEELEKEMNSLTGELEKFLIDTNAPKIEITV